MGLVLRIVADMTATVVVAVAALTVAVAADFLWAQLGLPMLTLG